MYLSKVLLLKAFCIFLSVFFSFILFTPRRLLLLFKLPQGWLDICVVKFVEGEIIYSQEQTIVLGVEE